MRHSLVSLLAIALFGMAYDRLLPPFSSSFFDVIVVKTTAQGCELWDGTRSFSSHAPP